MVYKKLHKDGVPVLLVSYADLLWQPDRFKQQILEFLPCIKRIPYEYFVPKLGVQVFKENKIKLTGDVASFASQNDPHECCQYDTTRSMCMSDPKLLYEGLDNELIRRAIDIHKELLIS